MTRKFTYMALAVALGFVASSCSEAPTATDADTTPQVVGDITPMNASAGRPIESASGGWAIPGGRTLGFNAKNFADGSVRGKWERVNHGAQGSSPNNGDVVCLRIIGNQAWIGTIGRSGVSAGLEGGFRVVDNGEGANATPDQASLQFVDLGPGGATDYCANAFANPPLLDVEAGNIQIR
jgi:hypothetical protein